MATEFKLSYSASEINKKLGKVDNLVATVNGVSPDADGNVVVTTKDGYSPMAVVEQTADGATISITDTNGTTTATIVNGKDGENGTATDAQVAAWLDAHPEATTTVEDGSISTEKLADDAVTPNKTTFFKKNVSYYNLYNPATTTAKKGVACENGVIKDQTYGYLSDYIAVEPGKSYYLGKVNGTNGSVLLNANLWAAYDSEKNVIPQTDTAIANMLTSIPDGVAYIRFTLGYNNGADSTMFVEGTEAPTVYVSYEDGKTVDVGWTDDDLHTAVLEDAKSYIEDGINISGDRVTDGSLPIEKQEGVKVYNLNIVNPDEVVTGVNLNRDNGAEIAYSYTDTTGFCPVVPGRRYHAVVAASIIIWYDADKKFLSDGTPATVAEYTYAGFVAPEGAAYLRCTFSTGKTFAISDYGMDWVASEYGAQKVVYEDSLIVDAMSRAVNNGGTVPLVKWERWNLVDNNRKIAGNVTDGVFSLIGSGGNLAEGYIIDVTPGIEYIFLGNNVNAKDVLLYDENWGYLETQSISAVYYDNGGYFFKFTANDASAFAIVECQGFCAVYRDGMDSFISYLCNASREEKLAAVYFPINVETYIQRWAVENLIGAYGDKVLQAIHNSKGLKWNCLGDSLTTNGWGSTMYNMVAEKLGLEPINYGIVSSTLADYKQDGTTQNPMCVRYAEMGDADIVTVMGGTNDYIPGDAETDKENTATVIGACHALFKGLIEKYPNARIGVILPPQWGYGIPEWVSTQGGDPNMDGLRATVNAVKSVAEYYSLPVCDLFNHGGIPGMLPSTIGRLLQNDHVHLKTAGHEVLSRPLLAFIRDLIG